MAEATILHVRGAGATAIGYGRLGVKLVDAIERAGVDVFNDLGEVPTEVGPKRALERVRDGRQAPSPTNVVSWIATPGHASWWHEGQHASVFTMWEATRLPEAYRESMDEFDTIIVPSEHNVELFGRYHPNVRYVPLGIDPNDWHYTPREESHQFRFLCGGSGARKGTDLAHKAFRTVFPRPARLDPVPTLVMKNPKGEDFYGPHVEMVTGRMSDADEIALYESCHVYVQPSRGEGFGLQPLQAIAQGMPTILTNAHGHAAYAHLGIGIGWHYDEAAYFIYGNADKWWEPDFDELCEAMYDTYHNYAPHVAKAKESARIVADEWTWDRSAQAWIDAHDGALDEPYRGNGAVHMPARKLYPVIVNRLYGADISGAHLQFHPFVKDENGKDTEERRLYWETADIKRILFEAKVLHPDCLTDYNLADNAGVWDLGLDEDQARRIPEYTAAQGHCGACGQPLNSKPTLADEIYEDLIAQAGA